MHRGIEEEPGQLLLHVLGISEWFSIYHASGCVGTEAALLKLNTFIASLNSIECIDEDELTTSCNLGRRVACLLSYPAVSHGDHSSTTTSSNIASIL